MSIDSNTHLSLAPAAGAGIGKAMFAHLLEDPGFPRELAEAARECLKATTPPRWDKGANGGAGGWTSGPDFRVRMQTIFGLLAQAEGMPIQRIIRESVAGLSIDLDAELAGNPALRDVLERRLRNSTWKHSGNQAYKRPAAKRVDAEVEPANGAQHEPSST